METKKWKSGKQILNELKEENSQLKKQTASQQQTIERLKKGFIAAKKYIQESPCDYDIHDDQYRLWKEYAEQLALIEPLLNTTEQIENFYCEHQKNGFMRCSKKCLACSDDI